MVAKDTKGSVGYEQMIVLAGVALAGTVGFTNLGAQSEVAIAGNTESQPTVAAGPQAAGAPDTHTDVNVDSTPQAAGSPDAPTGEGLFGIEGLRHHYRVPDGRVCESSNGITLCRGEVKPEPHGFGEVLPFPKHKIFPFDNDECTIHLLAGGGGGAFSDRCGYGSNMPRYEPRGVSPVPMPKFESRGHIFPPEILAWTPAIAFAADVILDIDMNEPDWAAQLAEFAEFGGKAAVKHALADLECSASDVRCKRLEAVLQSLLDSGIPERPSAEVVERYNRVVDALSIYEAMKSGDLSELAEAIAQGGDGGLGTLAWLLGQARDAEQDAQSKNQLAQEAERIANARNSIPFDANGHASDADIDAAIDQMVEDGLPVLRSAHSHEARLNEPQARTRRAEQELTTLGQPQARTRRAEQELTTLGQPQARTLQAEQQLIHLKQPAARN